MDRFRHVLEIAVAKIVEVEGRIAPDVVEEDAADADGVRLRVLLDARRHIHAVADEILAADHHIGEVQAEAQPERLAIAGSRKGRADLGGAAQSIDGACELDE